MMCTLRSLLLLAGALEDESDLAVVETAGGLHPGSMRGGGAPVPHSLPFGTSCATVSPTRARAGAKQGRCA
jgi:hypothetical protein